MSTITLAPSIPGDRRASQRHPLERACKVYDPAADKYIHADTCNLSRTGGLLRVPRILEIKPGSPVHVGIAMKRRENAVLQARDMVESTVVRVHHTVDDHTLLALQFDIDLDAAQPEASEPSEAPALRLAA